MRLPRATVCLSLRTGLIFADARRKQPVREIGTPPTKIKDRSYVRKSKDASPQHFSSPAFLDEIHSYLHCASRADCCVSVRGEQGRVTASSSLPTSQTLSILLHSPCRCILIWMKETKSVSLLPRKGTQLDLQRK